MDVVTPTDAPPLAPAPRRSEGWRRPLRWFGLACLMTSAFLGGYVAWLTWGTGVETARAQEDLRTGIERTWDPAARPPRPGDEPAPVVPGGAYAIIQIPSVGIDFVVVQGTSVGDLKMGPGHYTETADPWDDTGRVGVAGHRTTYQAPFNDLGEIRVGDTITLLTEFGRYDYEVTRTFVIPHHVPPEVRELAATDRRSEPRRVTRRGLTSRGVLAAGARAPHHERAHETTDGEHHEQPPG
jgi:LPXTG-site transpeptidase (sortase) family protein